MSYRELTMIDVKELLRRWQKGQAARRAARETGADRKTVGRYYEAAEALGLPREGVLADEQVGQVLRRVQDPTPPEVSEGFLELEPHKATVQAWLSGDSPLRLTKVHTLLGRMGVQAEYWTLRRWAIKELDWHERAPTVLLEDPPPGQEAQVDFGRMGMLFDAASARMRVLWALIVTLSFSRYQFVWPTFWQTTEAVCEGLDTAWAFLDGMSATIIPDNTKAMIAEPDALNPRLTEAFADYVQARDLFADPARAKHPKDKPRVENQVPYVRESWFAGEKFSSLAAAREDAARWCRDVAGMRVHGTTRQVPRLVYETVEHAAMLRPPAGPYDVPFYVDPMVHPDHHIQVGRALYSVPTLYLHKEVHVRADRTSVKVYFRGELIKVHPRVEPGKRSTDGNDYPAGKSDYALRDVDAVKRRASEKGAQVGRFAERLLDGPLPWARMRQAYALLRLCDRFGNARVDALCQRALAFDVVDVTHIGRMLKAATPPAEPSPGGARVIEIATGMPRFARPLEHFQTRRSGDPREEEP